MRPTTCDACGGSGKDPVTSRKLPCPPCSGKGFTLIEGDDAWARYRAHFNIPITAERLALEESLSDLFD